MSYHAGGLFDDVCVLDEIVPHMDDLALLVSFWVHRTWNQDFGQNFDEKTFFWHDFRHFDVKNLKNPKLINNFVRPRFVCASQSQPKT